MSKDEYLITDTPLKALTVFAMPMILGSFFQQVYNMADSIIVGQFVGSSALAAVGACAALTNVFICVALGAGVGAGGGFVTTGLVSAEILLVPLFLRGTFAADFRDVSRRPQPVNITAIMHSRQTAVPLWNNLFIIRPSSFPQIPFQPAHNCHLQSV